MAFKQNFNTNLIEFLHYFSDTLILQYGTRKYETRN